MIDVSVLIVTWNNEKEIQLCIESILNNIDGLNIEVIVVDNCSTDFTISKLHSERLKIWRNESNLGFTKAVNQAIEYSSGRNVLLLNPDTVVKEGCISKLNEYLNKNPDYGACCPKLLNRDGTVQFSIRSFPTYWSMFCEFTFLTCLFPGSRMFGKWKMKYFTYNQDSDVEQPMAATLMTRRAMLDAVQSANGGMDERFEMFFNDVDLCRKIIDKGYKIRYLTDAEVIHSKGSSVYKDRIRMIKIWNKDCVKYFEKYHKNFLLFLWLKINLTISGLMRIFYYKLFK